MEPDNVSREIASAEVPCRRCAKSMAIDRLYYAVNEIASVGYKCLSCGYEETRPHSAVAG
jgi:hypothetical protein